MAVDENKLNGWRQFAIQQGYPSEVIENTINQYKTKKQEEESYALQGIDKGLTTPQEEFEKNRSLVGSLPDVPKPLSEEEEYNLGEKRKSEIKQKIL